MRKIIVYTFATIICICFFILFNSIIMLPDKIGVLEVAILVLVNAGVSAICYLIFEFANCIIE